MPSLNTQNTNRNKAQNLINSNSVQNSTNLRQDIRTPNENSNLQAQRLIWLNETQTAQQVKNNSQQFFGRNLNLWQQNDTSQYGVCCILNVFEVLGIKNNLNNISAIRSRILRNRLNYEELKIENSNYYERVETRNE